jgi:hypothetical protein
MTSVWPLRRSSVAPPMVVAAVAAVSAFAGWVGVEALAALVLLAFVLPAPTVLRRLVVAVPVFVGASAIAFTLLSVAHVQADLRWPLLAVALMTFAVATAAPQPLPPWADVVDAWSAATAVVVGVVVAHSAFAWGAANVLARLATHTDAIRHISLGAAVERNDGYLTLAAHMPHMLPGLQKYPQGSSGFLAITFRAVAGTHPDVASTLLVGYWTSVAVLGLTAWLGTSLAIAVARRTVTRPLSWPQIGAGSIVIAATGAVGPQFLTFELGYFAQEVATLALLATLCVLVEARWRTRVAVTLMLLLVAAAQSWYLLTPILVTVVGWWWWRQPSRRTLALPAAAALPFVAFPFLTGPSPTNQVLASGVTATPSKLAVAALILGGGIALVVLRPRPLRARAGGVLAVSMATVMALMIAVGAVELVRAGPGSAYYAIKLFVLVLLFAGIAMGAGLPVALVTAAARERVLAAATCISALAVLGAGWAYFADKTADPAERTTQEARQYLQLTRHWPRGALVLIYDGCGRRDRFLSHAVANLSSEFAPALNTDLAAFMNSRDDRSGGIPDLARRLRGHLEIITAQPCAPQQVDRLDRLPGVSVIAVSRAPA